MHDCLSESSLVFLTSWPSGPRFLNLSSFDNRFSHSRPATVGLYSKQHRTSTIRAVPSFLFVLRIATRSLTLLSV